MATQDLTQTGTPTFAGVNAPNILSIVSWNYQASSIAALDTMIPRSGTGAYSFINAYYVPRNGTIVGATLLTDGGVELTSGTLQFFICKNDGSRITPASYSSPVRGPLTDPIIDTALYNNSSATIAYIDAVKEYEDHEADAINVSVSKGDRIFVWVIADTLVGGPDGIAVDLTFKWT